jgi:hypothetical protein
VGAGAGGVAASREKRDPGRERRERGKGGGVDFEKGGKCNHGLVRGGAGIKKIETLRFAFLHFSMPPACNYARPTLIS